MNHPRNIAGEWQERSSRFLRFKSDFLYKSLKIFGEKTKNQNQKFLPHTKKRKKIYIAQYRWQDLNVAPSPYTGNRNVIRYMQ